MSQRKMLPRIGLWLACGGLTILAAHHWLVTYEARLTFDHLILLGGALTGYLILAAGLTLVFQRRDDVPAHELVANLRAAVEPSEEDTPTDESGATLDRLGVLRGLIRNFTSWYTELAPEKLDWRAFDQLLREMLTEHFKAARVRAFHVSAEDQQLRGLSQGSGTGETRSARDGILGYVATAGREYFAADPAHGELVAQLARDDAESWDWVIPIRHDGRTVGLVAAGKLTAPFGLSREFREDVRGLLDLFWELAAYRRQLDIAKSTDKASGLLTRADFFASATTALAGAYAENEPVVAVVLALEGLRRLDDVGRWGDRDRLVENIGVLINHRIRTDDIIGRFSDDRFVLLLRRLDSGLGRLIAVKIQNAVRTEIAELGDLSAGLKVRIGLTGSGFAKYPLEQLLVRAFDAVEHARKQGLEIFTDLSDTRGEDASGAAARQTADVETENAVL